MWNLLRIFTIFYLWRLCAFCPAYATSERVWWNADETKSFTGKLLSVSGDTVTILKDDGSGSSFRIDILNKEGRNYCRAFAEVDVNSLNGTFFKVFQVIPGAGILAVAIEPRIKEYPAMPQYDYLYRNKRNFSYSISGNKAGLNVAEISGDYSVNTNKIFFLRGDFIEYVADNETFISNLYWSGTYSYQRKDGNVATVNSYTINREDAIELLINKTAPISYNEASPAKFRKATGSGFVISPDNSNAREIIIITNHHVVDNAKKITANLIDATGEFIIKKDATIVAIDRSEDLAMLKVVRDDNDKFLTAYLEIPHVDYAQLGMDVYALGFPNPDIQGSAIKISKGIINSLSGAFDNSSRIQFDAAIQPGNSGGPLVCKSGYVVGVVVSKLSDEVAQKTTGTSSQNVNYAIKSINLVTFIKKTYPNFEPVLRESLLSREPVSDTSFLWDSAKFGVVRLEVE